MIVSEIKLYEILKLKLGEKEAEALVEFVDSKLKESNETNLKINATKEDLARVEGRLESNIANAKVDIIKWMVALIIGLFIALVGSMAALIKLMIH